MPPRATAVSLFFGAIEDLVSAPGAVLRMAALPFALALLAEYLTAVRYVDWFNDTETYAGPPVEVFSTLAFFLVLGLVASAWHRFMILGEVPGLVPKLPLRIVWRYILAWFVIGLIVGLIVLLVVGLPLLLVFGVLAPDLGNMMIDALALEPFIEPSDRTFGLALLIPLTFCAIFAYIFLLFRMGMGMPSVAVRDGEGMGMRVS